MEQESLKKKTIKGVEWSAIDNISSYGVTFVVGIILARLLSPEDYGLIGIISIFTAICNTIINSGFTTALLREKEILERDYNTAFIINIFLGVSLYIIIYFCSPLIASFFNRIELVLLARVSSLGIILGALSLVQQTKLTKLIDFKTQTKITLIASIFSGAIGILLAYLNYGVWALVVQGLSSQIIKTILLWHYNSWIPKISFSHESFNRLFGFGWKMMVGGILDAVWKELYQVIVGKFYSPATLGQYTRAKQYSNLLSSNLTSIIQRVTYPVLSSIQDNKEKMLYAYRKIIKITMFITSISMFFLGAISEPLIYCLIGSKWHMASIYLPLICITSSLYPLHAINLNMLQIQGRSDIFLYLEIIKKIITCIPLFVGAFIGILPMLYINIIIGIINFFLNSFFSGKLIGYNSWMQTIDIIPSYIIAIVISIPIYFFKFLPLSNWIILPLQIIIGVTLLFILCKHINIEECSEIKRILKPYYKSIIRYVK